MVPHLVFVLTEVGLRPVETHPINSVSLSFVFIEGLHHILNPPQLFLDADVLLAGRLRLCVCVCTENMLTFPNHQTLPGDYPPTLTSWANDAILTLNAGTGK